MLRCLLFVTILLNQSFLYSTENMTKPYSLSEFGLIVYAEFWFKDLNTRVTNFMRLDQFNVMAKALRAEYSTEGMVQSVVDTVIENRLYVENEKGVMLHKKMIDILKVLFWRIDGIGKAYLSIKDSPKTAEDICRIYNVDIKYFTS